jgi:hypothetical protein
MIPQRIKAPDQGHGVAERTRLGDHGDFKGSYRRGERNPGLDLAMNPQARDAGPGQESPGRLAPGGDESADAVQPWCHEVRQGC